MTFLGNLGIFLQGTQSTVIRILNVAKRLEKHGLAYTIECTSTRARDILETIEGSDTVLFHRIQTIKENTY